MTSLGGILPNGREEGREEGRKARGKEGTTKEEGEMAKEILLNIFCRQSVLKVDMDRRFVKLWGICARLPANAWK